MNPSVQVRQVLILDQNGSPWETFLREFFEDTAANLHFSTAKDAGLFLTQHHPDLVFLKAESLSLPLVQKLKVLRQSYPDFRIFQLGGHSVNPPQITPDEIFLEPETLLAFQKQLTQKLALPEKIRVLVVDDEPEIGTMLQEFLAHRMNPSFEVDYEENGRKGLARLEEKTYEIAVLDVKMPEMDGRELYKEIRRRSWAVPVIVFFDAVTGDEILELRRWGRPCVVEKGARHSAMPEMMALIKKMVYFGAP